MVNQDIDDNKNNKFTNLVDSLKDLCSSWKHFITILFNPFVLILIFASYFLLVYSSRQNDLSIISLLTILISTCTGLLGGILTKKWEDITQEKTIVTRAKSATRNLQVLLESIISLEKRVSQYQKRLLADKEKKFINDEVIKTYLEEIVLECVNVEEDIINSIQDWTSILPEADLKSILNYIGKLKAEYQEVQSQLEKVNEELLSTNKRTQEETDKLLREKIYLQDQVISLKHSVNSQAYTSGIPVVSGSFITGGTISTNEVFNNQWVKTKYNNADVPDGTTIIK
jgi:hypothetical protein